MEQERSKLLGTEEIGKLLWQFSLPAMAGMIINALYNVVDSIFVGNGVGEIGLTAVTIAFPIMIIFMAFGMLVGVGATSLVSIKLGEGKPTEAEAIMGNALSMALLLAVILTPLTLFWLDPLLIFAGAGPDVLPYAREFSRIIVSGTIFMFLSFGLNNLIRAEGHPKIAMMTMVISASLNMILNPLFIFQFHWGIAGSAAATVCSQFVASLWVLAYFFGGKSTLKFRWHNLILRKSILSGIFSIGLSPFLMQIGASAITLFSNAALLAHGGDLAVAAMGVINRIVLLILMPVFGIQQGVQPIIGFNYGAKQYDRVTEALHKAVFAATALCIGGFLIVQIFDREIIRLFNDNEELIAIGSWGIRLSLSMLPVVGFQIVGANYFQAVGRAKYAILFSLSRQVIILIPLLFILPSFWGLTGVWSASPTADFASSLLTGFFLWRELKKLRQLHQA